QPRRTDVRAAEGSEVAVAQIVGEDNDDVRRRRTALRAGRDGDGRDQQRQTGDRDESCSTFHRGPSGRNWPGRSDRPGGPGESENPESVPTYQTDLANPT